MQRTVENRAAELEHLATLAKSGRTQNDYDIAFVGAHDKIIPAQNQLAFWKDKARSLECGHFPFYNHLDEIIAATV